ncbi:MAG TPA: hypothetical protein VGR37_00080 [Longimicrobiaceae bacterium]|nr:hypothetical protein [Longimicrobiaceae bacterium]
MRHPWLAWAGAALLLVALGALLDTPWVRARILRTDRARLAGALVRARSRPTPEPLYPFFRDLEEGGAALVMGGAVSGLLLLVFGSPETPLGRLALGTPLYLGLGLVTLAVVRLLLLAPRAFLLWLLRISVLGTERVLRLLLEERGAPDRIPFTYGALLVVWAVAAGWTAAAAARWWGGVAV